MASSLCTALSGLTIGASASTALNGRRAFFGAKLAGPQRTCTQTQAFTIVAEQNSKKRQRTALRNRTYNRSRRSAVATRSKKVLNALSALGSVQAEEELNPIQKLINEAYTEIDKAVSSGVLHKNTAARRKSRLARARQRLLIASGLYTPSPKAAPA